MGTPNIIVGSIPGSAQRLFNVGASGEFTVQNVGTVVIYLDDDSSVSQQTNEYFLLPGNTITWQAGVECWALAASGTGFVSLATSVTQYDNTAFTNGAIIASGNFVGLPMSNFLPLINTLGYLSVRITIKSANTQVVGTNTGSAIILFWNDTSGGSVGSGATVGQDVYYMNEGLLGWNGCEIVTDVRGTTLTIRNALIPTISGAFYNYVVRGYNTRVPPLAFEYDDGVNAGSALYTTKSINYTETVASAGQIYTLPMWSGKVRIILRQSYVGTVTVAAQGNLYPSKAAVGAGYAYTMVPTALINTTWQAPILDMQLDRQPWAFTVRGGTGYTSVTNNVMITFHGNEDS